MTTPEKMTERMRPAIKFWDGQRWRFCPDCQRNAFEFAAEFGEHVLAAYRVSPEPDAKEFIESRLVPPLLHGDEAHQEWLRDELRKWIPALSVLLSAGLGEGRRNKE